MPTYKRVRLYLPVPHTLADAPESDSPATSLARTQKSSSSCCTAAEGRNLDGQRVMGSNREVSIMQHLLPKPGEELESRRKLLAA